MWVSGSWGRKGVEEEEDEKGEVTLVLRWGTRVRVKKKVKGSYRGGAVEKRKKVESRGSISL